MATTDRFPISIANPAIFPSFPPISQSRTQPDNNNEDEGNRVGHGGDNGDGHDDGNLNGAGTEHGDSGDDDGDSTDDDVDVTL